MFNKLLKAVKELDESYEMLLEQIKEECNQLIEFCPKSGTVEVFYGENNKLVLTNTPYFYYMEQDKIIFASDTYFDYLDYESLLKIVYVLRLIRNS